VCERSWILGEYFFSNFQLPILEEVPREEGGEKKMLAPDDVDDLKRRLRQHDQIYATMQQQGKPFEALEHLEKGLFVRKELHGPDHPEVGKVCQVFTTSCNTLAMNSLQRGTHAFMHPRPCTVRPACPTPPANLYASLCPRLRFARKRNSTAHWSTALSITLL